MPTTFNTTDPKPGYVYDSATDTWFPLLGIAPGSSVVRWRKTVSGGETSVSGLDDLGATLSYNAGTEQVYLNGVLLVRTEDYLATTGTSVTGLTALAASDVIEVISFNATNVQITDALLETNINAKGDLIVGAAVDTAAILTSGTNGQVLSVNTATATGLEWVTSDDANAIQNAIVDAKGDIIAATAADTVARLAVGANDTVLTADSSTATGLKWAAVATGLTYVGCAAYRDTNLSVTKNTNTLLTLPSEQYDTDGFHSTSTNTGRFTVPAGKAGKYQINCSVSWSTSITEQVWLMLYINGSAATSAGLSLGRFQELPGTANTDFIGGSTSYSFNVGDYAEIYVFHNGTTTPINLDSARVTFDYLGA